MKALLNSIRSFLSRSSTADQKITVQSVVRKSQNESRSREAFVTAEAETETDAESCENTVPSLTILGEADVNDRTQGFDPYDSLRRRKKPHD